jgi:tRNA(Ile)-lysidine synthase
MAASRNLPSIDALRAAVIDCLDRHVGSGQRLLVGLSGGIDSVVLLHAVRGSGRPVSAIHVHHALSPSADDWTGFCTDLCRAWLIELSVERVTVERASADGLEAAARRARHAAYDKTAADWLLLAHHQGDRAETMLFNLLRGAGVRGAGALRECSGRILRPLLGVGRPAIIAYANAHGLRWVEDASNSDLRFSRNFLRHRVLPLIEERFPAGSARLAAAAGHFAEAADLLDELALADLAASGPDFPVDVALLAGLTETRARNVLRFLLSRASVGIPSEERLTEALRQCLSAAPDRHPAVTFGSRVLRRRAKRVFLELA